MKWTVAVLALSLAGCALGDGQTYTLYRTGLDGSRVHVATFDANESDAYNNENCLTAMELFQSQPGVSVRYWCERGRYKR